MTQQQNNTRFKHTFFYLIAILIPVLLFIGTEVWLRFAGKFEQEPLFIEVPNMQGYLQPNPNIIQRFFPRPEMTPKVSPDTQFFRAEKPEQSFRIVVQGGSTAAGFPYGRWGSLSGMLQQRFKRIYPEKDIEIINTAMSSVNTYTLLDFNQEIQGIQPDLVMIYAGHNEFLGVMGVGSAFASKGRRGATLLHLKANNLRIYKLVEHIYYQYFASGPQSDANQRTLMSKIAREKEIPLHSDLFQAGVEQFSGNLSLILQAYQKAGIPVLIGNLVSNESDQVPFSGVPQFNEQQLHGWLSKTEADKQQLITELQGKNSQRDPALTEYLVGKLAYSTGNIEKALHHYKRARDLDLLRFRAPGEFNQIIADAARRNGAILVDVEARMRKDTQNDIIGAQHMLEHLHPNERGYFILADAFLQRFEEQNYITDVVKYPDNIQLAWQERPISKADALYAKYKIDNLTGDYPFTNTPTEVQVPSGDSLEANAVRSRINGEGWLELNHKLVPQYHRAKDFQQDALLSGLLADALPENPSWGYIAGFKYKQVNNLPLALYYLNRDAIAAPDNYAGRLSLAQTYFFLGRNKESLEHLLFVKENKPDHPNIDQIIERVKSRL